MPCKLQGKLLLFIIGWQMSMRQPALKLEKFDLFLSILLPRPRPPDLTAALFRAPRRPPRTGSSPPLAELPRISTEA